DKVSSIPELNLSSDLAELDLSVGAGDAAGTPSRDHVDASADSDSAASVSADSDTGGLATRHRDEAASAAGSTNNPVASEPGTNGSHVRPGAGERERTGANSERRLR